MLFSSGHHHVSERDDLPQLAQTRMATFVAFAVRCRIAHFQQTISNSLFTAQKLLGSPTTPF